MTRLRSMVEETGAGIILVSHLRRVDGNKGHENGIEVSLSHLEVLIVLDSYLIV